MRRLKVDLDGASFPSDHIRIVSAELVRTGREEEARNLRETCLELWMSGKLNAIRVETRKYLF